MNFSEIKTAWPEAKVKLRAKAKRWFAKNIPGPKDFKEMFKMGGDSGHAGAGLVQIFGLVLLVSVWALITTIKFDHKENINGTTVTTHKLLVPSSILPTPGRVLGSYKDLLDNDHLLLSDTVITNYGSGIKVKRHATPLERLWYSELAFSVKINMMGYYKAILWSIVLGFFAGLFPIIRNLTGKYLDAIRYLPLTALTGVFIAWYGIYDEMKINFLAFGIFVYLMPIVVQRIDDTQKIFLQTAWTLGASKLQTLWHVYLPSVLSRVFDDIRVITAIGWTYIIVAELVNKEGGVGALIFTAARQSKIEKVFALLFVIIIVGFVQDIAFRLLDRLFFTFKYAQSKS